MDEWYYAENEERMGPVSLDALRDLLYSGQLATTTLVWRSPMENWQPAYTIGELSTGIGAATAPFLPEAIAEPAALTYAGFWKRFVAFFIDWVATALIAMPIGFAIGVAVAVSSPDAAPQTVQVLGNIVGILVTWAYYAGFESSGLQATPGKLALGIRVTDLNGGRVSFLRATGRHFGKILSALVFFFGFIIVGFTARKQGLHDMLAGCLVVNRA